MISLGWYPDRLVYTRVDQNVVCEVCGKTYGRHDCYPLFLWLTILCDGRLVKL